ncbi:dihydrodipicolinate synthase family protein [Synoicihabitans lomoniglobus]|uniref:Dihydrodipicolinate synthase family protein n=1 Tax=Synoicihabitans lomoniglobus TaxID=2909285 RepID=A0AAF0I5D7_9BACT|nr:dihydrodipicolinate synthase family protein [Opitutaceae bacterium LMO-M01]WED66990.1 dihydrodipicolinate synthase family protein [Opitutaceae bacterium LMO-M01]
MATSDSIADLRTHLLAGQAIPAHPLALDADRQLSERHQRALARYYVDAGCGGLAVAVHSTQFEIREPRHGLLAPVLELASQTIDESLAAAPRPFIKIAGVCGRTDQAWGEATLARDFGYDAALLSLAAWGDAPEASILKHCATIAAELPLIGFYLQPAVGGRVFSRNFWAQFAAIERVLAIKIAPFNRYQTLDVVRAVIDAGRDDIALYTGNDDTIVTDLLSPYPFTHHGQPKVRQIIGGLLGHWGVWSRAAVGLLEHIKSARVEPSIDRSWLARATAVTDMNAAVFDAANGFAGCIPGILEVLRRQGLVPTNHCLNPHETLSPGQAEELDRVSAAYPELIDDSFVAENLDRWLR